MPSTQVREGYWLTLTPLEGRNDFPVLLENMGFLGYMGTVGQELGFLLTGTVGQEWISCPALL